MGEEAAAGRYEPAPAFEEVKHEAMLDMSLTDSKEFWLIQWIKDKDFDVSNFHGKELSLKLQKDGNLGSLESSSGKSYDLVSFAYQQPNATAFLPSGSEMKAVGKISRRVCLFRHKNHDELERPSFGSLAPNNNHQRQQPSLLVPSKLSLTPSDKKSAGRKGCDSSALILGGSDMQDEMSIQCAGKMIGEARPSALKMSMLACNETNDSDATGLPPDTSCQGSPQAITDKRRGRKNRKIESLLGGPGRSRRLARNEVPIYVPMVDETAKSKKRKVDETAMSKKRKVDDDSISAA